MSWEPRTNSAEQSEIIECGRRLRVIIHCPVRLVSWDKPQYECQCGKTFLKFVIAGCIANKDFRLIREMHKEGGSDV